MFLTCYDYKNLINCHNYFRRYIELAHWSRHLEELTVTDKFPPPQNTCEASEAIPTQALENIFKNNPHLIIIHISLDNVLKYK